MYMIYISKWIKQRIIFKKSLNIVYFVIKIDESKKYLNVLYYLFFSPPSIKKIVRKKKKDGLFLEFISHLYF